MNFLKAIRCKRVAFVVYDTGRTAPVYLPLRRNPFIVQ